MRIISPRKRHETTFFTVRYLLKNRPGFSYSFDCTKDGIVDEAKMNPGALENYLQCKTGTVDGEPVIFDGVHEHFQVYSEPAVGECEDCKRPVSLDGFTCTCECGADYNSSGQRLAPRHCWGEETGESLADIMRGDTDSAFDGDY